MFSSTAGKRLVVRVTKSIWRGLSTAEAAASNSDIRRQLAIAHRGLAKLDLNEGICNHLSALAPARDGDGQVMLLAPLHQAFSEVTAESLIGVSLTGEVVEGTCEVERSAFSIHLGLRQSRPGAQTACVFHTHMPYATTLACLREPGLKMVHQNSLRFWGRVSYDNDYSGLATALDEGRRLGHQLDERSTVLFMANHGVLVVSPTVAEAFDNTYYLERACMVQVMAEWTGRPLAEMSEEQCREMAPHMQDTISGHAVPHLASVARQLGMA